MLAAHVCVQFARETSRRPIWGSAIYRSDDEGKSFVRISDDTRQYGGSTVLTGDPRVCGRVYMASGGRGILYGEPRAK